MTPQLPRSSRQIPGAIVLADLLEPLYDASIPTRQAAYALGRIKCELESMVERGERVAVLCRRHEVTSERGHIFWLLCATRPIAFIFSIERKPRRRRRHIAGRKCRPPRDGSSGGYKATVECSPSEQPDLSGSVGPGRG